jgi:hypothetical protein
MATLTLMIVLALIGTVGALITGVASMAHGGDFDQRHSHQFMAARVGFQGIALLMLLIALVLAAR